jgi:hypothetical protein
MGEKCLSWRNPGTYLVILKPHDIGIVTLPTPLKKVVV